MDINIEIKHDTIVALLIIIFLIVDLYFIHKTIELLFTQVSNTQYITTAMTARNQSTSLIYAKEGLDNQYIDTVIGALVLFFLAYIGRESTKLLAKIIENEKNANTNHDKHSNNKRPK